jgi:hypothetical protein
MPEFPGNKKSRRNRVKITIKQQAVEQIDSDEDP